MKTPYTHKMVSFSYATSSNAAKFGFASTGCYTVEKVKSPMGAFPKALSGHATREEAETAAASIALPWTPEGQKKIEENAK